MGYVIRRVTDQRERVRIRGLRGSGMGNSPGLPARLPWVAVSTRAPCLVAAEMYPRMAYGRG